MFQDLQAGSDPFWLLIWSEGMTTILDDFCRYEFWANMSKRFSKQIPKHITQHWNFSEIPGISSWNPRADPPEISWWNPRKQPTARDVWRTRCLPWSWPCVLAANASGISEWCCQPWSFNVWKMTHIYIVDDIPVQHGSFPYVNLRRLVGWD